jgi:hypothetical protein
MRVLYGEGVNVVAINPNDYQSLPANSPQTQGIAACVIFHDGPLAGITTARPVTLTALGDIAGIGARKLERYGSAVIELVRTLGADRVPVATPRPAKRFLPQLRANRLASRLRPRERYICPIFRNSFPSRRVRDHRENPGP